MLGDDDIQQNSNGRGHGADRVTESASEDSSEESSSGSDSEADSDSDDEDQNDEADTAGTLWCIYVRVRACAGACRSLHACMKGRVPRLARACVLACSYNRRPWSVHSGAAYIMHGSWSKKQPGQRYTV
jgi:hypothetical protein